MKKTILLLLFLITACLIYSLNDYYGYKLKGSIKYIRESSSRPLHQTKEYFLNKFGKITEENFIDQDQQGKILSIIRTSYDNEGNEIEWILFNLGIVDHKSFDYIYKFDDNKKIIEKKYKYSELWRGKYYITNYAFLYKYNSAGNCIEKLEFRNNKYAYSTFYKYDENGNLLEEYFDSSDSTKYIYNKKLQLVEIKKKSNWSYFKTEFKYNQEGLVSEMKYYEGWIIFMPLRYIRKYEYNQIGNIIKITEYDRDGKLTEDTNVTYEYY